MTRFTAIRAAFAAVLLAALAGCIIVPFGTSNRVSFNVALTGDQEVPPVMTTGTGTIDATYDKLTRVLTWRLSYSGLSGQPTAAHFHGPARAGGNSGVALGMASPITNPTEGKATLTPEQASDLLAGLWYVNVHTAVNPGGEVRGQMVGR
jgi:hypothetical protein